ncbi:MAG: 3-deoxy-D-manno-octulosonic acid transferase [Bacteroidales bacterium]|nr:3-deoxy-D-manno-octulosonic acid transferase [Bacteroidales bacterium]
MRIIYTIGIFFYGLGIRLAALFGGKARLMVEGWRSSTQIPHSDSPTVWFHASSLGEFEQARPVIELFRQRNPNWRVVLTFFSPSGYEIRKNYSMADVVRYLPLDTPTNAAKMVEAINPSVAFFVKYDFWYNHLGQLRKRGVRTCLFSAIFRPSQYFFKPYGGWFCKQLKTCFTNIFVQDEASLNLLKKRGVSAVSVAGDTRFDRVADIVANAKDDEIVANFASRFVKVLLAGSSWQQDEAYIKRFVDAYHSELGLVLAPHQIEESHLAAIEQLFGNEKCIRYSRVAQYGCPDTKTVMIIDNIGKLSSLYRYTTVAYIGGGWGKGIHNLLEAVTWGKPVVFGPNYHKFREAHDLIACGGGFSYSDFSGLEKALSSLLNDSERYRHASQQCELYVKQNIGSSLEILNKFQEDSY